MNQAADWLGVSAECLEQMNLIREGRVMNGQVLRYRTDHAPSEAPFASLYIVQKGDLLRHIAGRFHTGKAALRDVNEMDGDKVFDGQVLKLPPLTGRETLVSSPATLLNDTHILQKGQSLSDIAKAYGVAEDELRLFNGLNAAQNAIPGQILHLRPYGAGESYRGAYVVRRFDTLTRIGERFQTTARKLYEANEIQSMHWIYPGQIFVIPEPM